MTGINKLVPMLKDNNMKKQILTLTLIILSIHSFAQWTQIPSGTIADLKDVHFPSNSVGYAVGNYGIVLKSIDAGNTWLTVHTDSALSFQSVFFTSEDTGYAAGGNLYKTTNGGANWTEILTDSLNQIIEVFFVNNTFGFASGTKLYKSINAGISWTSINLNNIFSSIYFPSDSVGYFIGGPDFGNPLYKTIDGGQNYIPITNGFQSIKESTYFINDSVGYMCGWYSGVLVKTTNGGINWQQVDTINSSQCWDVYFVDENIGYYIDNEGGTYIIRNTIDGGVSWTTQLIGTGIWLNAFHYINSNTAVAVGDSGTIYKTINGGGIGIQEMQFIQSINIYPNPFSSSTTLERDIIFKDAILTVYNSLGQQVKLIKNISGKTIILHRDNLQSGLYFIRLTEDNKIIATDKLVITD